MTNEITLATGEIVDTKRFNKNVGNNVIAITIRCKKIKSTKGNTFNSIKGLKNIPYINKDGINKGFKNCWLDVHFTKDAFKGLNQYVEVYSPDDLTTGTLYVQAKYIQSPSVYKVTTIENKETGELKNKYPTIWIKGGIVGFESYVSTQDEFNYVKSEKVLEIEPEEYISLEDEETETDEKIFEIEKN